MENKKNHQFGMVNEKRIEFFHGKRNFRQTKQPKFSAKRYSGLNFFQDAPLHKSFLKKIFKNSAKIHGTKFYSKNYYTIIFVRKVNFFEKVVARGYLEPHGRCGLGALPACSPIEELQKCISPLSFRFRHTI